MKKKGFWQIRFFMQRWASGLEGIVEVNLSNTLLNAGSTLQGVTTKSLTFVQPLLKYLQ